MNNICLVGRLTTDLEIKQSNNKKYGKFTLAVNRLLKKNETDFINCTAFGKTAETLQKYCKKGHRIGVQGRIHTSTFEKNGEKRSSYTIIVDNFYFLQNKNEISNSSSSEIDDDEFPFL